MMSGGDPFSPGEAQDIHLCFLSGGGKDMTEPEELGLPERRNHDLPVRDTGKIKASWGFSQHRAREAGGWPEEQGQGGVWEGVSHFML